MRIPKIDECIVLELPDGTRRVGIVTDVNEGDDGTLFCDGTYEGVAYETDDVGTWFAHVPHRDRGAGDDSQPEGAVWLHGGEGLATVRAGLFSEHGAPICEADWIRHAVALDERAGFPRRHEAMAEDVARLLPAPWFMLVMSGRAYVLMWKDVPGVAPCVLFDSRRNRVEVGCSTG